MSDLTVTGGLKVIVSEAVLLFITRDPAETTNFEADMVVPFPPAKIVEVPFVMRRFVPESEIESLNVILVPVSFTLPERVIDLLKLISPFEVISPEILQLLVPF